MTQAEKKEYQKAYVELYEIIKVLPEEEQKKIPKLVLKPQEHRCGDSA